MSKKPRYRITNWRDYNAALKNRGSLTFWIDGDIEQYWYADSSMIYKQGRPLQYSDTCINCMLTLRQVYKLPLRQLTGFIESFFLSTGKCLKVPEFSRLSKRSGTLHKLLKLPLDEQPLHIVIDSTGLKVFGEKEWLETKHGKQYQRKVWRKLHIGIDQQGYIANSQLTSHKTDDRACVLPLVTPLTMKEPVKELLADRGYDSHRIYEELRDKVIKVLIPPSANAAASEGLKSALRDQSVSYIKAKGYWAWFRRNNFGRRARVENTFYRIKTLFGRKLLSRTMTNQQAESRMVCLLLNKVTSLGMPKTIKIC